MKLVVFFPNIRRMSPKIMVLAPVRQPGFAPGFSDWRSDVLDETGRLSLYWLYNFKLKTYSLR
jgi:hypothetical protein